MAGPIPPYLTTQSAAQTAFTVPFGLITLVNNSITTATAAGEFNTTVDCSLFVAEDVSNLRIYLDSLGYRVEFAKNSNNKSLLIDWGQPLDIDGSTSTSVTQGTTPWVVTAVPSPTGVNLFASNNSIPSGAETILFTYITTFPFHISQIVGWGNTDAEFLIKLNGNIVGGGMSSPSERTLDVTYAVAPIPATTGDVVTITVRQDSGTARRLRVNLLGE